MRDVCLLRSVIFCKCLFDYKLTVFSAFRICNYLAISSRKITSLLQRKLNLMNSIEVTLTTYLSIVNFASIRERDDRFIEVTI